MKTLWIFRVSAIPLQFLLLASTIGVSLSGEGGLYVFAALIIYSVSLLDNKDRKLPPAEGLFILGVKCNTVSFAAFWFLVVFGVFLMGCGLVGRSPLFFSQSFLSPTYTIDGLLLVLAAFRVWEHERRSRRAVTAPKISNQIQKRGEA